MALIPGVRPTLTVGGRVFTDLASLIYLVTYFSNGSNSTFRKHDGSAGYQVTAAKTLKIYAYRINPITATSAGAGNLAQTDNDVGLATATALSNPVYPGGDGTTAYFEILAAAQVYERDYRMDVAAQKYFSVNASGTGVMWAFGYEV